VRVKKLKPKKIAEIVHGGILLAIALMMGILLLQFRQIIVKQRISIASIRWFSAILIVAIAWLAYRGTRIILSARKDVE